MRSTLCGLSDALSVMVTDAVRVPGLVGVKVTLIVQLAPAAKLAPQVLAWMKSPPLAPVMEMPVIVRVAVPLLVKVSVWAPLLLPTATPLKLMLVPDRVTAGATPLPVSDTLSGLSIALSVIVTEAVRAPTAVGVKFTAMVQLAPAATELPHVLAWAKSLLSIPVIAMLAMVSGA
jgi:hypothetical protein